MFLGVLILFNSEKWITSLNLGFSLFCDPKISLKFLLTKTASKYEKFLSIANVLHVVIRNPFICFTMSFHRTLKT